MVMAEGQLSLSAQPCLVTATSYPGPTAPYKSPKMAPQSMNSACIKGLLLFRLLIPLR